MKTAGTEGETAPVVQKAEDKEQASVAANLSLLNLRELLLNKKSAESALRPLEVKGEAALSLYTSLA